ncbi:MAG: hypothetical protein ABSA85_17935 [Terracidiphilus sp.]
MHDRDILFVPDSAAKALWNRIMESAVQSAVGVSIYSGLVYSQWFLPKLTTTTTITGPPVRPRPLNPAANGPGIEGPQ